MTFRKQKITSTINRSSEAESAANADVSLGGGGDCGDCGRRDHASSVKNLSEARDVLKHSEYGGIAIALAQASNEAGLTNMNSKTMKVLGSGGKVLGGAANIGSGLGVYLDYDSMTNGEISEGRFAYRTTSTVASFAAAGRIGGWKGVLVGGAIGAGTAIMEQAYDKISTGLREGYNRFINTALKNWMSYR